MPNNKQYPYPILSYLHLFLTVVLPVFLVLTYALSASTFDLPLLLPLFLLLCLNPILFGVFPALTSTFALGLYFVIIDYLTYDSIFLLLGSLLLILAVKYRLGANHRSENTLKRLSTILSYHPHSILTLNQQGVIQKIKSPLIKLLGHTNHNLRGRTFVSLVYPADRPVYSEHFNSVSNQPGLQHSVDLRLHDQAQQPIWLNLTFINLFHHPHLRSCILIIQDISRRKELDDQRLKLLKREKKARALAERAVRSRDEFLSVASHELRTPLTTILLQLQTTIRRTLTESVADFSGEKLIKSLKLAEAQSQRLKHLIRDLLNTSLISTGRLELQPEKTSLTSLIKSCVKAVNSNGDIKIKFTPPAQDLNGHWDPVRLEQALINLLTNAVKYGQHKPITINAKKNLQQAVVSVTDQGVGIASVDLERIFQSFERGENKSNIRGLGVGLFIARRVAEAHGGNLSVTSKLGEGSTFTLTLPLDKTGPTTRT